MNFAKSTLALLTIGMLCCSLALAKPIRETFTPSGGTSGLDENGNFADNSPNKQQLIIKAVFFPKSGILINRAVQKKTVNASGKRQVFRNIVIGMENPGPGGSLIPTRARLTYPKGRARKMNEVTARDFSIHNPKKAPPQEVE